MSRKAGASLVPVTNTAEPSSVAITADAASLPDPPSFDAGDIQEMRRRLGEATAIVAESSSPINLCTVLLPYARIANHEGRHRDVARLVGAYNRVEEDYDVHIPPVGVQFLGDPGGHARAELGDDAFELARREGFALSLEQVFALVAREASTGEPSSGRAR